MRIQFSRVKKTLCILLAVCFLLSVTASASANENNQFFRFEEGQGKYIINCYAQEVNNGFVASEVRNGFAATEVRNGLIFINEKVQ
jgi:hypothetical protein